MGSGRGRAVAVLAGVAAGVAVSTAEAAAPLTAPAVDLVNDYEARVIGERGIGLGQAVNAGDVNGDGIPDALVSAPGTRSIVYVVYGRRAWLRTVAVRTLTTAEGYRITTGENVETMLPVANAGDVNGDSVPDQLIGIPNGPGRVYVVYGQRRPDPASIDLDRLEPSQGYRIEGVAGDSAGTDVANAGDVNGDGVPDQLIGAPQRFLQPGRAYVVYGRRPGAGTINLGSLAPSQGYRIDGAPFDEAGNSVRSAGDVNADGVPDALVGAMSTDRAYVVYGQRTANPAAVDLSAPGSWGYGMQGIPTTLTGASVDNAGDVNGDGLPDALVGASCEAGGPTAANVYVVYGQRTPPQQLVDLANLSPQLGYRIVDSRGACAGTSVAGLPDVNRDGVPDQLVGAFGARFADGDGAAYIVYGQRTSSPRLVDLANLQPADGYGIGGIPHASAGWFVADAGDVDGDGANDAWIWAPNFSPTPTSTGAVYLVGRPQPVATPVTASAALTGGRIVTIRLACAALPGTGCGGTLTLRRSGRPPQTLGSARYSIAPNAVTAVSVALTRRAIRSLRRARRLAAEALALTQRVAPATPVTRARRILLRSR